MSFTGVCVATVAGLDDPEGEARVRVEFPMLPSGPKSAWAPLARPFAGADRGMYFMPEVGDEALVAFEHGDFDHPFIVGFLWNGKDGQPDDGIDARVRRIQSKAGHQIDMDDRPGKHAIVINTAGGNSVKLSDTVGTANIEISTPRGTSITVSDVTGIAVTTPLGRVDVSPITGISVTSTTEVTIAASTLTLAAGLIKIAGAVEAVGTVTCTGGFFHRTSPTHVDAVT